MFNNSFNETSKFKFWDLYFDMLDTVCVEASRYVISCVRTWLILGWSWMKTAEKLTLHVEIKNSLFNGYLMCKMLFLQEYREEREKHETKRGTSWKVS